VKKNGALRTGKRREERGGPSFIACQEGHSDTAGVFFIRIEIRKGEIERAAFGDRAEEY